MDETQLKVAEPNQLDTPPTEPMQEASPKVFPWWLLVIILLVLFSGIVYYLARQNKSLQSQLTGNSNVSQSPLPSLSPDPSIDPVADWQVYENNVHHVSFKYPQDWDLIKEDDKSEFNASIKLKKDDVVIHMIFGVNGIGGAGTSYKGTPIKLDGHDVYKYTSQDEKNQIVTIGITDILTESLGVLQLNNKTYIINLRYPSKYKTTGESLALETTFDQILSTYTFSGTKVSDSNMIHYVLKDKISTIDYPKGWKITDNTKQIDLYQDGKLEWSQDVELTLNDYKITSRNPLAWGPSGCIFPDSPSYSAEQEFGEKYSSYVEFSNTRGIYRRAIRSVLDKDLQNWSICTKDSSGGFGGVSGFGASSYVSPQKYDESVLTVMDAILMSMNNNIK